MTELWNLLVQLGDAAWQLLYFLGGTAIHWLLPISWFAWWLFGVNWNRAWPVLRTGAWVAIVLGVLIAALVWAQLAPSNYRLLDGFVVPNFWWQLTAVAILAGLTLFCGWLQQRMGWAPAEIDVDVKEHAAAHGDH